MNTAVCHIDLAHFFPFSQCSGEFCAEALQLGKSVHYSQEENILLSDAPAKYCGLILNGEAISFHTEDSQHRFSICKGKGCFIGLEALHSDTSYREKTAALTDIDILFWNNDSLQQLQQKCNDFSEMMRILDEGRCYQDQYLVPENDISDPVLCSLSPHPLFILKSIFPQVLLALLSLLGCSVLLKQYPSAWLLAILLVITGLFLFIRKIIQQKKMRFVLTPRNMVLIPGENVARLEVIRLADIDTVQIVQNRLERLFYAGTLLIHTSREQCRTFSIDRVQNIAQLMHQFSPQSRILIQEEKSPQPPMEPCPEENAPDRPFQPVIFHAHWAFLIHSLIKPFLAFILLLAVYLAIGPFVESLTLRRLLIFAMFLAFCAMVYEFFTWEGNRFIIEEDRVWDCYKKPFAKEDQNVAMNQKIQSVRFKKSGFFQILFNYGTVFILAGEGELTFNYVGNPEKIQHLIMDTCSRYEEKLRHQEESRRNSYISELVNEIEKRK